MSSFIEPLNLISDKNQILENVSEILKYTTWEPFNQIGLRHRPGCLNQWTDSIGSLYDREENIKLADESDFLSYNDEIPFFIKNAIEELRRYIKKDIGRARLMRLMPKTGLSIHTDFEKRYHLALDTNDGAIFAECVKKSSIRSIGYNIPADNRWYSVDTTRFHYVYNGGKTPRIHLVICPIS